MEKGLREERNIRIMRLHVCKKSLRQIADIVGISKSAVHKIIKGFNTDDISVIDDSICNTKEVIKKIEIIQLDNSEGRKLSFSVDGFEDMEVLGLLHHFKRHVERKIVEMNKFNME